MLIYGAAFAVAGAVPFLLLPILTKTLSPVEFGEVTSFLILAGMIGNIAGLSSHGFVAVRYFKSTPTEFSRLVSSSVWSVCCAHAVALVLMPVLFPQLRRLIDLPLWAMSLAVVAALLVSLNLLFLSIYQSSGKPLLYLRARLVQGGVEFLLCVGLIFLVAPHPSARILSYSVAVAASVALGLHYCAVHGHLAIRAHGQNVRELISFSVPMIPHILAGTAIAYLDRVMVSSLLGADSLGIYMVGMQIGMAMIVVIEPLNKALAPWLFEQLSKRDSRVNLEIVRNTYLLYASLALTGLVVVVLSRLLFDQLIGSQYTAAKPLIPWMVVGFVFQGMYYSVVNYVFYAERTGRLAVTTSTVAVAGCLLSFVLISRYGLSGAGVSFALNNLALFGMVWAVASRLVPMPWLMRKGKSGAT